MPPNKGNHAKHSIYAIEERRRKVYEYSVQGVPETKIAEVLGVHRNTIASDLKAIRDVNRERVSCADPYAEIGDHDRFLREMEINALFEYAKLQDEYITVEIEEGGIKRQVQKLMKSQAGHRQKFLDLAMQARRARMDYQLKTGVVPKAPEQIDLNTFMVEGVDIRKITPEAAKMLKAKLLRKMLAKAARDGGLPPDGTNVGGG